ncbi:MAG: hypothetical protein HY822_11895 [Acidobacteria bacterium]|nr:hypothetical protein [Acidobacteriota bacterium]
MDDTQAGSAAVTPLAQALDEARAAAREQLAAAWQLQVERIEEQLHAGWRERLERVFEERFAELGARLGEQFESAVGRRALALAADSAQAGRRAALDEASLAVRRLTQARTTGEWAAALLDGFAAHCSRCLLLSVGLRAVIVEGFRGFGEGAGDDWTGREIPLDGAPAFATAIETRDIVVAVRLARELSPEVVSMVGESEQDRAHLYPVLARGRCAAVVYVEAAGAEAPQPALDLLATVAGLALGVRSVAAPAEGLVAISAAGGPAEWTALPQAEQELHLRAQRFARVQVAEMRLYHSAAVRFGRARQTLYEGLKEQIDGARSAYQRQFVAGCPSMTDYLHQELVRTLANGDQTALGPAYPGPLA